MKLTEQQIQELIPLLEKFNEIINKEEEFVLPEKWCVLRTVENEDIIDKWRKDNFGFEKYDIQNERKYIYNDGGYNSLEEHFDDNYKYFKNYAEITFDQFKKYVLKEDDRPQVKEYTLSSGKKFKEGDVVWFANKTNKKISNTSVDDGLLLEEDDDTSEIFATKEEAEQWLEEYKLSQKTITYKELKDWCDRNFITTNWDKDMVYVDNLLEFIRNK